MRFRLLSYVAAMLLLAGVLGANLTAVPHPESLGPVFVDLGDAECPPFVRQPEYYGWPFCAVLNCSYTTLGGRKATGHLEWYWDGVSGNAIVGLAIPIAGLLACEFVLRRWVKKAET